MEIKNPPNGILVHESQKFLNGKPGYQMQEGTKSMFQVGGKKAASITSGRPL